MLIVLTGNELQEVVTKYLEDVFQSEIKSLSVAAGELTVMVELGKNQTQAVSVPLPKEEEETAPKPKRKRRTGRRFRRSRCRDRSRTFYSLCRTSYYLRRKQRQVY